MARKRKTWSETVGGRGHAVTVFERTPGGPLYLRWWDPTATGRRKGGGTGNYRWRSLGHRDREVALAEARQLAAQLLAASEAMARNRITLTALFAAYEEKVSRFKKGQQPREDARRMVLWTTFLGGETDPSEINSADLEEFVRARRAGAIKLPPPHVLKPNPTDSTIGADIVFLQSVLNWGVRARLLESNPVARFKRPKTKNPKRPVASYDRYLAVREKADEVDPQRLFGPFLDLIESLGWRVSAVCQIWASDIDRACTREAPFGRIRKRGEVDKEGVGMWVPLTETGRAAIDRILELNPVVGNAYLFPSPKKKGRPWSRWHARDLLERAERAAGIDPQDGGDFHPYRRKWATERKHLPTKDVAAAGGWRDPRSLQESYQQIDPETLLAVVMEPRKLRSAIATAIAGEGNTDEAPAAGSAAGART